MAKASHVLTRTFHSIHLVLVPVVDVEHPTAHDTRLGDRWCMQQGATRRVPAARGPQQLGCPSAPLCPRWKELDEPHGCSGGCWGPGTLTRGVCSFARWFCLINLQVYWLTQCRRMQACSGCLEKQPLLNRYSVVIFFNRIRGWCVTWKETKTLLCLTYIRKITGKSAGGERE